MVLSLFGLKRAINFVHFGLESGLVFKRTTGVYVLIPKFQMNKKGRDICKFDTHFKKSFSLHSNLSNDEIIS